MAAKSESTDDVSTAVADVVHGMEELGSQQLSLFRAEIRDDLQKTLRATMSLAVSMALLVVSVVLAAVALIHLVQSLTSLPIWTCYALAALVAGVVGLGLAWHGRKKLTDIVDDPLPETTRGLKENARWAKRKIATPS
jgi:protein-S-isoprenylcysteine O-methyltransferase Ste14